MASNKTTEFEVSQRVSKALTWVLVAYLLVEALVETGNYIGLARVSSGPLVYGISRITQSRVGEVLLSLCSTGLLLSLWEVFRRSLMKAKSLLWYVVIAIMALVACDFLVSLIPDGSGSMMEQLQHASRFDTFSDSFRAVSGVVQSILGVLLSIVLIVGYRGRLRAYGWVSIVCPLAWGVAMAASFSYMVDHATTWVGSGLSVLTVCLRYVLGVLPYVFLRRTMVYKHVHEAQGDDLNQYK